MRAGFIFLAVALHATNAGADDGLAEGGGRLAASYFALAANGAHSCGLAVDMQRLRFIVLHGGMDGDLVKALSEGVATPSAESRPAYQAQYAAWKGTLELMSRFPGGLGPMCQSIWDRFGDHGSIYLGLIAKPKVPYSPDQLR